MEKLLSDQENIQNEINLEWLKYKQAIRDNKPLEEVKIIYLRIKELQSQIIEITEKIHNKLKIGD